MARLDLSREAATYAPALTDVPTLSPMERTVVENTWRGRMLNEHASARVFAGLVPQLMAAEVAPRHQAAVAEMVAEELHHARLCAGVLHALGAEPAGELPALAPLPVHADAASPLEALMRNVLSVSCLSETVAVALIDAERRALLDSPLAGVLKRILGDEVGHARLGWTLLAEHPLDDALRQRLSDYLRVAFAHLEAHELANLSPVAAPAGAMALGACDGALARDIFHATVEEVIVPGLERHGLDARAAWEAVLGSRAGGAVPPISAGLRPAARSACTGVPGQRSGLKNGCSSSPPDHRLKRPEDHVLLAEARRILFVDDEPQVLQGLQRMLRPYRNAWKVLVANSGAEALDLLQGTPVDVVVSDMRMPKMDGITLLREVAVRHPETIRMVLTGYSSQDAFLKSVGPTHQVLAKPCEAEQLISTLERAVNLRETLASPALRSLAGGMDALPALPDLYAKVVAALGRDASMHEVGGLVAKDPGMATRILQLVNSAYFGLNRPVADPIQAVSYLGVDLVRGLILSAHVFSELGPAKAAGLSLERMQRHSQAVAMLARQMIIDLDGDAVTRDVAYLAGLLHDTGYLVLGARQPKLLRGLVRVAKDADTALSDLEAEHLGATHGAVGAYLLGLWGLPDATVEAVAYHHDEARALEAGFGALSATHLAERIIETTAPAFEQVDEDRDPPDLESLAEQLGAGAHLESWLAWAKSHAGGAR